MTQLVRSQQAQDLQLVLEQPDEVLIEFCKLAIEYINSGINEKKCTIAAKKLVTTYEIVQSAVEALLALLIDSTKLWLTEDEFRQSMRPVPGVAERQIDILWQFVSSKRTLVDGIMRPHSGGAGGELFYRALDWRIEGRVASRAQPMQATPVVRMKFHLDSEPIGEHRDPLAAPKADDGSDGTRRQVVFETDPSMVVHMIKELERALVEVRTRRVRRIAKST